MSLKLVTELLVEYCRAFEDKGIDPGGVKVVLMCEENDFEVDSHVGFFDLTGEPNNSVRLICEKVENDLETDS